MATTDEICNHLALMLYDCNSNVKEAYGYTQPSIDRLKRPCFLVFPEDLSFTGEAVEQEIVEESYSIAYVGEVFNTGYRDYDITYERRARQISYDALKYLLEHKQLQISNQRGNLDVSSLQSGQQGIVTSFAPLSGVLFTTVDGRSGVTMFTRDGIEGEAFWGFTIDMTVRYQLVYELKG